LVFIIKFLVKMKSYTMTKVAVSHHLMGVGRTNLFCSVMKLHLGLVLLMSAGLLVSCSRSDEVEPNGGDSGGGEKPLAPQDVQVRFSSALSGWTSRAANGLVYKVDISNQSSPKAIDLLYHKGIGTAYNRDNKGVGFYPLERSSITNE
jgi:hypothetical protein